MTVNEVQFEVHTFGFKNGKRRVGSERSFKVGSPVPLGSIETDEFGLEGGSAPSSHGEGGQNARVERTTAL